jgi:MOSC domain-containing protein YiiM
MKIISVNVGLPREVVWKGMTVQTGIFQYPVDKPVTISKLNLAGDQQVDLTVHGRESRTLPSTTSTGGGTYERYRSRGASSVRT